MKKIALLLCLILLTGCSHDNSEEQKNDTGKVNEISTTEIPTAKPQENYTAIEVATKLKEAGLPIENIIEYNEQNDVNGLLGKPNSYTSKVNFADSTLEQFDKENPDGGSIEVFNNEEDMEARKTYIETVSKGVAFAQQFYFTKGNILLRLDHDLSIEQATKYEEALESLK